MISDLNPALLFDKRTPPERVQALSALNILLGGLGRQPAARVLAPSLASPPPKQEVQQQKPILGGTANG